MSLVEKALERAKANREAEAPPRIPAPERPLVVAPPEIKPQNSISIDLAHLVTEGLLPPDDDRRKLAHQYRVIKRQLLRNAFRTDSDEGDAPGHFIMIASAVPGDGKTFTCINLAFSIASERDHGVLLIDGDIAKPHISRTLGCGERPGLLDLLRDRSLTLDSVVLATDQPGLTVLPAGKWSDDASELVASDRMQELLSEIGRREPTRVVLLDSPPVLATSDARVLAAFAGQVLLVVRSGATPQSAVRDAVEALKDPARTISLVLNRVETSAPLEYAYGYGMGYGYGGGQGTASHGAGGER